MLESNSEKAGSVCWRRKAERQTSDAGVIVSRGADIQAVATEFINAIAQHRYWKREALNSYGGSIARAFAAGAD